MFAKLWLDNRCCWTVNLQHYLLLQSKGKLVSDKRFIHQWVYSVCYGETHHSNDLCTGTSCFLLDFTAPLRRKLSVHHQLMMRYDVTRTPKVWKLNILCRRNVSVVFCLAPWGYQAAVGTYQSLYNKPKKHPSVTSVSLWRDRQGQRASGSGVMYMTATVTNNRWICRNESFIWGPVKADESDSSWPNIRAAQSSPLVLHVCIWFSLIV